MKRYPLVFGLRDLIQGNGFLAGVDMEGRALMHEEDDGYVWIEGINPGGRLKRIAEIPVLTPEIEIGHIRAMTRQLGIIDCAKRELEQLR